MFPSSASLKTPKRWNPNLGKNKVNPSNMEMINDAPFGFAFRRIASTQRVNSKPIAVEMPSSLPKRHSNVNPLSHLLSSTYMSSSAYPVSSSFSITSFSYIACSMGSFFASTSITVFCPLLPYLLVWFPCLFLYNLFFYIVLDSNFRLYPGAKRSQGLSIWFRNGVCIYSSSPPLRAENPLQGRGGERHDVMMIYLSTHRC